MTLKELKQKIDGLLKSNPEYSDKKLLLLEPEFKRDAEYKDEHFNHYVEANMYFINVSVTNNRTKETENLIYIQA